MTKISGIYRAVSMITVLTMANMSVPFGAITCFGVPLAKSLEASAAKARKHEADDAARRKVSASHPLTASEETKLQGATGECPYLAGSGKWAVQYEGIDIATGNYSTTATDLSFDTGYGIPVNVTRSYSSNNLDDGPFGKGWTLSADLRSTAGGLLKSAGAPVRSIPTVFMERPSAQLDDPNAESAIGTSIQPPVAVLAVDASGKQETIQKDVDGVLTTPPWDNNVVDSTYENVTQNGVVYQVLTMNTLKTTDGTVYVYRKHGVYPNGTKPWNNTNPSAEPANVLKIDSATDRNGSLTTYHYSSESLSGPSFTGATYQKSNGLVWEHRLTSVVMPGGHEIDFAWTQLPTTLAYRIGSVSDNGGRVVRYTYGSNQVLASATLASTAPNPPYKTTTYGYATAWTGNGYSGAVATNLLNTITDPRGLQTKVYYAMGNSQAPPFNTTVPGVLAYRVDRPNGTYMFIQFMQYYLQALPGANWFGQSGDRIVMNCQADNTVINECWPTFSGTTGSNIYTVSMLSGPGQVHTNYNGPAFILWSKTYDARSQNLTTQVDYTYPWATDISQPGTMRQMRGMDVEPFAVQTTTTANTYNFMGNPLMKTVTEAYMATAYGAVTTNQQAVNQFAYWGQSKYFQQMATLDPSGRMTYSDYYDSSAAPGYKGQIYRVYDPKYGTIFLDPAKSPPSGANPLAYEVWRYQVSVSNPNAYSASFNAYDTQGRATDVFKLSPTGGYVETKTTYGGDGAPTWGQATDVYEDAAGVNRHTRNVSYTSWGKPSEVVDAAGHDFVTTYDAEGTIQSIRRTDVSQTLVTYTYGTNPPPANGVDVTYGQPATIADGLSGVVDTITYQTTGAAIGQISSVGEVNGANTYSSTYGYDAYGQRSSVIYGIGANSTTWQYANYVTVGDPLKNQRVFQTMRKIVGINPTAEEYQYTYDTAGRIQNAAFAQTPKSGFTPTAGNPWYDSTHLASTRARTFCSYDPGGRVLSVENYWDTWNGSGYNSEAILANTCAYEVRADGLSPNRGVKSNSKTWVRQTPNSPAWAIERTDTYSYDPQLDYLAGATYGDGLPNNAPLWSYDPAGNRTDSVCDNLNRATSIGGVTCTNDVLGNRLTKGATSYTWDATNRMTSLTNGTSTTNYSYRGDGMRVSKSSTTGRTLYCYDGQMGMEDIEYDGSLVWQKTSDFALGGRGIDAISVTTGTGTTISYPIYDAHGNMISTLSKAGAGYTFTAERSFDAWGVIRLGAQTGDPKGRYCASLGHKQDDESGLVYMRARYFEPGSGRFVSEDPGRNSFNWFIYAGNDPIGNADSDGKVFHIKSGFWFNFWMVLGSGFIVASLFDPEPLRGFATFFGGVLAIASAFSATDMPESFVQAFAASGMVLAAISAYVGCKALSKSPYTTLLATVLSIYDATVCALLLDIAMGT